MDKWFLPANGTYFNSTMVRLKDPKHQSHNPHQHIFQFHYGTIKRINVIHLPRFIRLFQFHYGTIKSPRRGCKSDAWPYFNSTMVRLKAQIHPFVPPVGSDFNSTMVRLKGNATCCRWFGFNISIPLWYD